jgi:acetolactate synthase-1/2/3 large subunit
MPSTSTGGELLAHLLAIEGVEATNGGLDESFADLAVELDSRGVDRIAPSTESAAVHMAAAWAHTTNRLGVAFVAAGAGLAHALPAMAAVQASGDRVLVISTSRREGVTGLHRPGLVASLDNAEVTRPLVKWSARVPSVARLADVFRAAMRACWFGAPGVVHLDVPTSVLSAPATVPPSPPLRGHEAAGRWRTVGRRSTIAEAAGLLVRSRRPIVHLGRGVVHSGAEDRVRELVATLDAGVTTTWGARGVVPEDDLHVVPPTHPGVVDDLRNDADVVLVLGADLGESDWWGQPPNWGAIGDQTVIQVDIDGDVLGRNRPIEVGIVGDAASVLDVMLEEVEDLGERDTVPRRHWLVDHRAAVRRGRENLNEPLRTSSQTPIHPAVAVVSTRLAMPDDTIWVFDGGHTRRWGQFHIPAFEPRSQLGDGRLELSGAGLALGMGARRAAPDRSVCVIMGDGALTRQLGDVPTSIEHDLPLVVVVLVDGYAGPADPGVEAELHEQGPRGSAVSTRSAGSSGSDGSDGAGDDGGPGSDSGPGGGGADGARGEGRGPSGVVAADGGSTARSEKGRGEVPGRARGDVPNVAIRSLRDLGSRVQADPVRYDLVARALGAWGEFVDHPDQLGPALERAAAAARTTVVHVSVDRVEHTWTPEAGMFRAQRAAPGSSDL